MCIDNFALLCCAYYLHYEKAQKVCESRMCACLVCCSGIEDRHCVMSHVQLRHNNNNNNNTLSRPALDARCRSTRAADTSPHRRKMAVVQPCQQQTTFGARAQQECKQEAGLLQQQQGLLRTHGPILNTEHIFRAVVKQEPMTPPPEPVACMSRSKYQYCLSVPRIRFKLKHRI